MGRDGRGGQSYHLRRFHGSYFFSSLPLSSSVVRRLMCTLVSLVGRCLVSRRKNLIRHQSALVPVMIDAFIATEDKTGKAEFTKIYQQ